MRVSLTERAIATLADAQPAVQKAFIKQINSLARNLGHPSLHAKKYDEAQDLWRARITDDWALLLHDRQRRVNHHKHPSSPKISAENRSAHEPVTSALVKKS